MEQTPLAKQRIHLMDELRGFAVFCLSLIHISTSLEAPVPAGWDLPRH